MTRPRIRYTLLNVKWTILTNLVLLVINFFSRNVFLSELGSSLVGLTGTMVSYIGFLNLMDLGIGTAVTQALYKPISTNEEGEIRRIISLFGFMFRWVGIAVGVSGIILSFFFPIIFSDGEVGIVNVYAAFYTYLLMTLMSYFINYRQAMLIAAQKSYLMTRTYNIILVVKFSLQMAALVCMGLGYLSWLAIEFLCQVFYVIWLERKINSEYPWLKTSFSEGRKIRMEYPGIFRNIKHIFSARIASVGLAQSDKIIISSMLTLKDVANVENFTMITARIVKIVTAMFTTTYASIGNIIALNDREKARLVFRQLTAMYFLGGAVLAFGFATFANGFIRLWLHDKGVTYPYLLVLLIAANMFIAILRSTYDSFLNAYGLYGDYPAAWTELGLNIVLSIVLTFRYGLIGTIIGTTVSTFAIGILWKPFYLFTRGFKDNITGHYALLVKYFGEALICWFCVSELFSDQIAGCSESWIGWLIAAASATITFGLALSALLYATSRGMRELVKMGVDTFRDKYLSRH